MTGGSSDGPTKVTSYSYNSLKQLTSVDSCLYPRRYGSPIITPRLATTAKSIAEDNVSGEQVSFTYDTLNRLATAGTQSGFSPAWSQSYGYDGFGNLTQVNGSSVASYDANNHGGGEDANGNPGLI